MIFLKHIKFCKQKLTIFFLYHYRRSEFIGCLTVPVKNILENNIVGSFMLQPQSNLVKPIPLIPEVDEKLTKIEETFHQIQEGKDDNALLQYLELSDIKNFLNSNGRTPFTLTKTITKQEDDTFGFEISWTKPPKINSVRNCCGLQKGDFIIFVGETNIVTMPKEEIISLIRKQVNSLTLEVFRPIERINSKEIIDKLALQSTPIASSLSFDNAKRKASDLTETPKSRKSCLFKSPKVCFQPTIGSGVIV
jgi:PDZ domain